MTQPREVWLIEAKSGPGNNPPEGEWRVLTGMTKAGGLTEEQAKYVCRIYRNSSMGGALFRAGIFTDLRVRKYVATDECSPA